MFGKSAFVYLVLELIFSLLRYYYHSSLSLRCTFMHAINILRLWLHDWTIYLLIKYRKTFKQIALAKKKFSVRLFVFTSMLKSERKNTESKSCDLLKVYLCCYFLAYFYRQLKCFLHKFHLF